MEATQGKGENYTEVVLDWDVFKLAMESSIFYLALKRDSTLNIILLIVINAYIFIKLRIGYTNYAYMMLPYFL